ALAPVAADLARPIAVPDHAPAVGTGVDSVGDELDLDALAGKQRADQLLEAAREDERIVAPDELVETRTDARFACQPGVDLVEPRVLDGRELDLHQLAVADLG